MELPRGCFLETATVCAALKLGGQMKRSSVITLRRSEKPAELCLPKC